MQNREKYLVIIIIIGYFHKKKYPTGEHPTVDIPCELEHASRRKALPPAKPYRFRYKFSEMASERAS